MHKIFVPVAIFFCLVLTSCDKKPIVMKEGEWVGVLDLSTDSLNNTEKIILPFNFTFSLNNGSPSIIIKNAEERIEVDEIELAGDSINFKMPVFDSEFRCQIVNDSTLSGTWINHSRKNKNIIPFLAHLGSQRFIPVGVPHADYSGKWEVTFSPNTPDSYKAIGQFVQNKEKLTGTFLTETGDYRFLEGIADAQGMKLSAFDGSHAFLFHAKGNENKLEGTFYSGIHWSEPWIAVRNDKFELRNPDSLTVLKREAGNINFKFPNLQGKENSLSDEKFKNKVVILQIMGSWCPNCMDESALLANLYKEYNTKGLEVVALAYEKSKDFDAAAKSVSKLKKKLNADYEFLITGKTGKEEASESLPFLSGIMAFPTTVFIDKKGNVRKIHTGFNGPATGDLYKKTVEEMRMRIEGLLSE